MPAFAQIVTRLVETIGESSMFKALSSRLGSTPRRMDLEKCARETPELADHVCLEPQNDPFMDRSPQQGFEKQSGQLRTLETEKHVFHGHMR